MFHCDYFITENDDHIASYVEIFVVQICVCAMFQEITQNKLSLSVPTQEMRTKRRLLLILIIIVVIIWFASLRHRDTAEKYEYEPLIDFKKTNDSVRREVCNNPKFGDTHETGTIGLSETLSPELEIAALKQNLAKLSSECRSLKSSRFNPHLPVVYAITPTYARPVQKAELTRLSHTLMLVPNLHWIVIEDAESPSSLVGKLLKNSGIAYTHLTAATPKQWKLREKESNWKKPRGVLQRNTALQWIRNNLKADVAQGVIYFADDDNSYGLEVFEEMRDTQMVSVWPVGLAGGLMVEMPVLDPKTGHVTGWNSAWRPERPFPVDMAGFAINLSHFLKHPEAKFSFNVESGYQESEILRHLVTQEQLEPKADNCTRVYVWHTRTEAPKLQSEKQLNKKGLKSNAGIEV